MAKAKATTVTIADLAEEYGLEGKDIRALARKIGLKATPLEKTEGFGPKAKVSLKN